MIEKLFSKDPKFHSNAKNALLFSFQQQSVQAHLALKKDQKKDETIFLTNISFGVHWRWSQLSQGSSQNVKSTKIYLQMYS